MALHRVKLKQPEITTLPIDKIKPNLKNPRKGHAVKEISRSIEAFGMLNPIVIQKGTHKILAGHGRFAALMSMGVQEVPVVIADVSDDEAMAYTIADNKLTEKGEWDEGLLASQIRELNEKHLDILTGFNEKELEGLTALPEPFVDIPPADIPDRQLQEFDNEEREKTQLLAGYRTAIDREEPGAPVRCYEELGILKGEVLDYGCGQDIHNHDRFDPAYYPNYDLLKKRFDIVMCNYVFNVIPLEHNRVELLITLLHLLKPGGKVLCAIWNKADKSTWSGHGYQCGWSRKEWDAFLSKFTKTKRIKTTAFWGWAFPV